jgi:hypothetical protein
MINVLMCADSIVIPTQAELLSTQGLAEFLANLYRQTICEYMPHNPAAIAYENFVKELMSSA